MAIGTLQEVTTGNCSGLYYLDTGMYGTSEYGVSYILDSERPAVIETGTGLRYEHIVEAFAELGIDRDALEVIAVTHIHLDHAGGAGHLAAACPNADVYVSSVGARHLVDPSRLVAGTKQVVGKQWEYYAEPEPIPEGRIVEIDGGDVIDCGSYELRVHEAPGHAPHQVVFEEPTNDAVFTGDAAGIWIPSLERVKETSPPPQFDFEACLADVQLLQDLERSTLLFTHFGPRANDGILETYAGVLEAWVEEVREQRAVVGDDEALIEAFGEAAATSELATVWNERKARTETAMNVRGVLSYLDGG